MKHSEAKAQFIQAWGTLGSSWGINRTMSQIHALLIISPEPLTTEQIMNDLKISRGNANMNLRALMEWGLVKKQLVQGERKEYFTAGKDVMEMAKQIAKERKRREMDPIIEVIRQLQDIEGEDEEAKEFRKVVGEIGNITSQVEGVMDRFIRSESNWFMKTLLKMMR